jgi:uncharacterized membrane protein YhfC
MTQPVSVISIIGMVFTVLISIGLPIALMVMARKKLKSDWLPVVIGAGTFIVFAMILEKVVFNSIVVAVIGTDKLTSNIWIYALFGGLEAAVFEELGRFASMKLLMKKKLNKQNSIMFGIGHGGIEAILLVGISMISNIMVSIMINSGTYDATLSLLDPNTRAITLQQISVLWLSESWLFFMSGVERIAALAFHISASYLVYRSVKNRKPLLLCIAIGLHFLFDAGVLVLSNMAGAILTECFLVVFAAAVAVVVFRAYRKEKDTSAEEQI